MPSPCRGPTVSSTRSTRAPTSLATSRAPRLPTRSWCSAPATTTSAPPPRRPGESRQHGDQLLDEERIALGDGEDPRRGRRLDSHRQQALDQLVGLVGRRAARAEAWWCSARRRPARPAVEQLGAGEAEQQDGRVAAESRQRIRRGRGTSARPTGYRRERRGAAARRRARAACAPPRRSPPAPVGASGSRAARACLSGPGIRRPRAELLTTSPPASR